MNQLDIITDIQETLLTQSEQLMSARLHKNEPAIFHLASGGGRTRAKLCIASGTFLDLNRQDIVALASCIELLHNASLVHDDLQDNDDTRRGSKAAWKVFGKNAAICAGDLMINEAYHCLTQMRSQNRLGSILQYVTKAVADTIHGQTNDLSASDDLNANGYEAIAAGKSGPLFVLSLLLPLVLANHGSYVSKAERALNRFAIAYQILDDIDDWELDKTNNQLNVVNLLAKQASIRDALITATLRAEYLLRQCISELEELPNQCATPHKRIALKLLSKAKAKEHE